MESADLSGKKVVLGVSGGIAAYKSVTIASLLVQSGIDVDVILTESAAHFIQPLTFSAITHKDVHTDPWQLWRMDFSGDVTLAHEADLVIVAPATAATIARLALGLADDLIGLVVLATAAPVLIAPAMEQQMFEHPATQQHLATLGARGVHTVGPESGRLASGGYGIGRMAQPESIVAAAMGYLTPSAGLLRDRKVVVTAGGTREPIDPIRYIGNRSSGQMGHRIAAAAAIEGAQVALISTVPVERAAAGTTVVHVETAEEMLRAVEASAAGADVLIMAAAVADFRPERMAERKIKKEPGQDRLDLRLVRNPDILAAIDRPGLLKIGFAAETEDLVENARRKLVAKGLAMIVANDATATIGAEDVTATIIGGDGVAQPLPRMSKASFAQEIVRRVATLLRDQQSHSS